MCFKDRCNARKGVGRYFYTSLLKGRANPIRKCANNWSARIIKVIRNPSLSFSEEKKKKRDDDSVKKKMVELDSSLNL